MSYRKLEVWQAARELSIKVHEMTLKLPSFEWYEEGRQVRRSAKSIRSNIVEGYGRRRYKADFVKYLIYAHSSTDETVDHLDMLWETKSLTDESTYKNLKELAENLGRKLYAFIQAVEKGHRTSGI